MRQRKVKKRSSYLQLCSSYIYEGSPTKIEGYDPHLEKGEKALGKNIDFRALNGIDDNLPVYIEIGSGKGRFLTQKALQNPDKYYLACEGGVNINVRILQKAQELGLKNFKVIMEYIVAPLDWFAENSLDGIYINFCDPWPKDRHANRRLTYRRLLEQYKVIAKPGACLEFKTDNDPLFEWSLLEFEAAGLEVLEMTRDLWHSEYADGNIPTEYEEKFASNGKTINYIKLRLK